MPENIEPGREYVTRRGERVRVTALPAPAQLELNGSRSARVDVEVLRSNGGNFPRPAGRRIRTEELVETWEQFVARGGQASLDGARMRARRDSAHERGLELLARLRSLGIDVLNSDVILPVNGSEPRVHLRAEAAARLIKMAETANTMRRPAFLGLAQLASSEGWCWRLYCTTCGHGHFRWAFSEIARGLHPDSPGWRVRRDESPPAARSLPRSWQRVLVADVARTRIADLSACATFPDWLGYLGLVLAHTADVEQTDRLLTQTLAPQMLERTAVGTRGNLLLQEILADRQRMLQPSDLVLLEQDLG